MILLHSLAVVLATLTSIAIAQMYTGSGGYAVQTSANTSDAFYPASVRISYSTTVYTATRATTVFTTFANFTTTLVSTYVTQVTELIPVATSTISEPTAPGNSVDFGSDETIVHSTTLASYVDYVKTASELISTPTNELTTQSPSFASPKNTLVSATTFSQPLPSTFFPLESFVSTTDNLVPAPTTDETPPSASDNTMTIAEDETPSPSTTLEPSLSGTFSTSFAGPASSLVDPTPDTTLPGTTAITQGPSSTVTTLADAQSQVTSEDETTQTTTAEEEEAATEPITEDDSEETPASEDSTTAITTEARSPTALSTTVILTLPNDEVIAFPIPTTSISIDLTDFILSGLGLGDSQTDSASFLTTTTPPSQSQSPTVDDEELPATTTLITTSTAVGGNATETSTAIDQDDEEVVPFDGRAGQVGVKDSVWEIAVAVVVIGAGLVVGTNG